MGGSLVMAGEGGLSALTSLNAVLGTIIALGAVGALLATWLRWARPRWKARQARQDAFEAAILGRPAVMHPEIPGKILAHAVPGIGERQARQEEQMASLVESMSKIADTHARVDGLDVRVAALEQVVGPERMLQGIESVQLLQTIEAVAKSQPPEEPQG